MTIAPAELRDPEIALASLERVLRPSDGLLVAFSGGVDSSVLLAAAHRVLGAKAIAFTADSPSMARRELQIARDVAQRLGAQHIVRPTDEIDRDEYIRNDPNRCYWCKHTLFETCEQIARDLGIREIAYGYTADDVGDFRPGHRAAGEFGVRSPLLEAGLRKPEIRSIARMLRLQVWDKPAAPCLSSRIPHGSPVSADKLRRIEAVEELLSDIGFNLFPIGVVVCQCGVHLSKRQMRILEGNLLRRHAHLCGIARDQVMAIGDNFNDIEMLAFAGHPVIMGNACEELRSRGWTVTRPNDQCGFEASRAATIRIASGR